MEKLSHIRKKLIDLNIDALLVTTEENIRYLTGFTGSLSAVLITKTESKFFSDFRYDQQSRDEVKEFEIEIIDPSNSLIQYIASQVIKVNITKLGFESLNLPSHVYSQLREHLNVRLIPTTNAVEEIRAIKSHEEIESLRKAASIGDIAFKRIKEFIHPGMTEIDIANELEYQMRREGGTSNSSNSSNIMVSSGYRTSLPHGIATEKVIEKGDLIMLDFGSLYQGYRSDMTRMLSIGEP